MKILICVESLTHGGAERVASLWATGFVCQGHEVDIVLFSEAHTTYEVPKEAKIYNIAKNSKPPVVRYFFRLWQLREIIEKVKPNVIITVLQPYGWWTKIASLGLGIPVIFTDHNSYEWPQKTKEVQKLRYFHKFYTNKIFDYVTVLTEADRKVIGKRLRHYSVLPNPLTLIPVTEIPRKDKIIVAAGRLVAGYTKGFDLLIKAFARISEKYPEWKLYIVGGGTEELFNKYMTIVANLGVVDKVVFLGFKENIQSIFLESEVFVLSSRFEGFGMVLLEAMSQGCACIACDFKGRQREILSDDKTGVVCEVNSVDSLVNAIDKVLCDDEYRHLLQKGAIKRSKDFELSKIMEKWQAIFSDLKLK